MQYSSQVRRQQDRHNASSDAFRSLCLGELNVLMQALDLRMSSVLETHPRECGTMPHVAQDGNDGVDHERRESEVAAKLFNTGACASQS